MNQYGKILSGDAEVTCPITEECRHVGLVYGETCPEGFYEIVKDRPKPTPADGEVLWFTYVLSGDKLLKHYFCRPLPRKLSKLKIYQAVTSLPDENGVSAWTRLQTWLESKNVNGLNGWLAFQLAQEISDVHPLFDAWSAEARAVLGLSEDAFERLLSACILDE